LNSEKAKKRRDEVFAAARMLFMKRPYEAVSIADLEQASGLTRGSIYYYFSGKEEIYTAIVLDGLRLIGQGIAEMAASATNIAFFVQALVAQQAAIQNKDKALFDMHFRFFFGRQDSIPSNIAWRKEVDAILAEAIETVAKSITNAAQRGEVVCDDPHFTALAIWGLMVTTLQMDQQSTQFRSVGRPRETLTESVCCQILALLSYKKPC
jgi:AcrR family transcriptional regulator